MFTLKNTNVVMCVIHFVMLFVTFKFHFLKYK